MSGIVNIISAIGNNSSVYPLLVRDCGIEIPTKLGMTYSQNLKDSKDMANNALRERFIDEYGTSAVWIGGIPLIDWLCDKGIRKLGFNPDINPKLFKESKLQGIRFNIEKFKNIAPKEVEELKKVMDNRKLYERLLAGKFLLSTAIPITIMGFILPKANFALTNKLRAKKEDVIKNSNTEAKSGDVSFKGVASTLSNFSTVNKMAVTDGGLTVGRVYTARNKFEKMEMAFKMLSMMFLNFVAPIWIAKLLDKLSNKLFKTDVNLDPKLLADKEFVQNIKDKTFETSKNNLIEYLDRSPESEFAKCVNKYLYKGKLYKGKIRDPRVFIDEEKLNKFKNEIDKFSRQALESNDVEKFAKKALKVKSANIITNVAISSFLLAVALPKITFVLRKKVTGSDAEPGLVK